VIAHNNQFVKNEAKKKYSKNRPCDVKDGLSKFYPAFEMLTQD